MNKRNKNYNHEKGSAILWVLVAVALFAALNFAFNSNSRTSTSLLSDAEAEAYANQIIQYGNEVKSAVKRLTLRGCSDTEISFENDIVSGYTNPNSPADKSCHVFDVAGGGLSWENPPTNSLDKTHLSLSGYDQYFFSNLLQVLNVGTDCSNGSCTELAINLSHVDYTVCEAINKNLSHAANLSISEGIGNLDYDTNDKFQGTYTFFAGANASILGDQTGSIEIGRKSGCYYRGGWSAGNQPYEYYSVLIER